MGGQAELSSLPISSILNLVPAMALMARVTRLVKFGDRVIKFVVPKTQTALAYAKHELVPPSPSEIPQIKETFNKMMQSDLGQLKVKQVALNALVGLEIVCWFFVGEVIGRGCLRGYDIPGCVNWEIHI